MVLFGNLDQLFSLALSLDFKHSFAKGTSLVSAMDPRFDAFRVETMSACIALFRPTLRVTWTNNLQANTATVDGLNIGRVTELFPKGKPITQSV
jgi:hypothetical protein